MLAFFRNGTSQANSGQAQKQDNVRLGKTRQDLTNHHIKLRHGEPLQIKLWEATPNQGEAQAKPVPAKSSQKTR